MLLTVEEDELLELLDDPVEEVLPVDEEVVPVEAVVAASVVDAFVKTVAVDDKLLTDVINASMELREIQPFEGLRV